MKRRSETGMMYRTRLKFSMSNAGGTGRFAHWLRRCRRSQSRCDTPQVNTQRLVQRGAKPSYTSRDRSAPARSQFAFSMSYQNLRFAASMLACLLVAMTVSAQEIPYGVNPHTTYTSAGIYGGYQSNLHSAGFRELPGSPSCCPRYTGGYGNGFNIGGFFQIPVSSLVALQLKGTYASLSGKLTEKEHQSVTGEDGGQPVDAVIEHRLASSVSAIGIEPTASFFPFDFPLSLKLGANISYILSHTFSQEEALVSPSYLTFANGEVVRNVSSGPIPNAQSIYFGIVAGAGYDLPLSKTLVMTPEILYVQSITNVSRDVAWKINTLRASVAITYPFIPVPPPPRPAIIPIEPVPAIEITIPKPPPPAFMATLDVEGVFKDKSVRKDFTITVEETEFRETLPLLPNIFFPAGSADITQSRLTLLTTEQTAQFTEATLSTNIFEFYAHSLNVIGKRLQNNPTATITCWGIVSTTGQDKDNTTIAQDRANAVRDYLIQAWNIAPDRIKLRTKRSVKGSAATNPVDIPDIEDENRRVEISSDEYELHKPVLIKQNSYSVSPAILRVTPVITSQAGMKNWELFARQKDRPVRQEEGAAEPGQVDWELLAQNFDKEDGTIDLFMKLHDQVDQDLTLDAKVPFEFLSIDDKRLKDQADLRIEKYSLILFEFDNATLDAKNRRILDEVKSRIEPSSKVTILGFTDRIGTKEYNKSLAESRCREVARYVTEKITEGNVEIRAVGSDELVYPNELPEGRNYSRTVQIIIETQVVR